MLSNVDYSIENCRIRRGKNRATYFPIKIKIILSETKDLRNKSGKDVRM